MKRMNIEVNGIVQGVGFRPFIHKLVQKHSLNGWVKNSTTGVLIEVEGEKKALEEFVHAIRFNSPSLAVIEKMNIELCDDLRNHDSFEIVSSMGDNKKFTMISPDVCVCDDCIKELFDKSNRRYRFPFINCTNCGPRFTIIKDIPYDREETTMGIFPMCHECSEEYSDISDRRYHAQPDCCFECGPELSFIDSHAGSSTCEPIEAAKEYIKEGKIVAIKGLGGFHLACNARKSEAVSRLRIRKHRDEKPFAIMCRNIETVKMLCYVSQEEEKLLMGNKRPIVLLKKKSDSLKYISLDNDYLGVMLPYTPIHYLILEDDIDTLVMTSGNVSDLPVIYKNEDALRELGGIADGFLMNNRDIYTRCDDSLIRVFDKKEYPIRRSRGYVPFPIKIMKDVGQVISCGAEQKSSFAVTKEEYVFLSQHIGDLKNIETFRHYEEQMEHFKKIFDIEPEKIACDLHPEYMSTGYAEKLSEEKQIPLYYVQHHHAHMASCMADNNIDKKVIGIIWDGTGFGTDGRIWGGEFLVGNYSFFERRGSIRPLMLPGGDKAIEEIYRIGYFLLKDTIGYIPEEFKEQGEWQNICRMLESGFNCPGASSIGRLFDGIAALLSLKTKVSYEGQGAILLENIASESGDVYSFKIDSNNGMFEFDWRPMIFEIVNELNNSVEKGCIAAKFMNTLVEMAAAISQKIGQIYKITDIVISGGVFQNMYLLERLKKRLESEKFRVYCHCRVSTNDEGIALGQAVIAAKGGGSSVFGSTIKNS